MNPTLRSQTNTANLLLVRHGLVVLTWGNASAIDRAHGHVAIKPSGVDYDQLNPETVCVVDLDGRVLEGGLRPSSDTPTHLALYKAFGEVGGIVHTHSPHATMFAQARRAIPCLGTTHADTFRGAVPLARELTPEEVEHDYEANTARVIIEAFAGRDPMECPGVLCAGHGPFAWGRGVAEAVKNAVILEEVARMAIGTLTLNPDTPPLAAHVAEKHYQRKHGAHAYYGQPPA